MYRVVPVFLLAFVGCREPGALQAHITIDPDVQATCIALDVLPAADRPTRTVYVSRTEGKNEAKIAVLADDSTQAIQLQARALWGPGCPEGQSVSAPTSLVYNGKSALAPATFTRGDIQAVNLTLFRPGKDEDDDADGFVAAAKGGPDCDDKSAAASPVVAQDACDASADLNCNGLLGCDDTTCSAVSTCLRVATSLAFTSASIEPGVGDCAPLIVERRDKNNQPTAPNYATRVQVGATVTEGLSFFSDSDCAQSLSSFSIDEKQTSRRFYAKGTRIGERRLLASADGLEQASLEYKLRAGDATKLALLTEDKPLVAGVCLPLLLEHRDVYDNPTVYGRKTVELGPTPTSQTAFYRDAGCGAGNILTSADFQEQATQLTVYFKSELANVFPLRFSNIGPDVTRSQTVNADVPSRMELALTPPAAGKTLLAGECSRAATVKAFDRFNNPSAPASGSFGLFGQADRGVSFYLNADCTAETATVSNGSPVGTATFYYKVKTGGGPTALTVAASSGVSGTQPVTVTPTVRRGTCTMASGSSYKQCPITPKLNNRSKSFVVFQATTSDTEPRTSFVRCQLKDDENVTCNRYQTGLPEVQIQWQVVELASGLKVQHLEGNCSAPAKGILLNIPARVDDPSKAFLLYSSSKNGAIAAANDFVTVRFSPDATKVDIAMDPLGECNSEVHGVQVVEWDGVKVARGTVSGPVSVSPFFVTDSFTAEEGNRSLVLSTFQIPAGEDKIILCNRMLRSEVDPAAPRLIFSRGFDTPCNVPSLSSVAWERIQFPVNTTVQPKTLVVTNAGVSTTASLSPVDPSRTLLLASSQAYNGQGGGETNNTATDMLGIAMGRLTLESPTELKASRDVPTGGARWTVYAVQLEP